MGGLGELQVVAVVIAAGIAFAPMVAATARLQWRRADGRATARAGTPAESGLYAARAPEGARVFDGFAYRVGARFAGRSRVVVDGERVSFCGPRGPYGLYWFWIWLQGLLLAASVPLATLALVTLDPATALIAAAVFLGSLIVMAVGAGVWPGLGEVPGLETGLYPALEHSLADARGVTLGPGWSDGGLATVLILYRAGIDKLAAGHAVSWFGPDERGREVRYALHCYEESSAGELYAVLGNRERRAGG